MLVPVIALFVLLGLMAGLAVYLIKQQKQADGVGAGQQPEAAAAAAPRVSGVVVLLSPVTAEELLHHLSGTAASVPDAASSPPDVHNALLLQRAGRAGRDADRLRRQQQREQQEQQLRRRHAAAQQDDSGGEDDEVGAVWQCGSNTQGLGTKQQLLGCKSAPLTLLGVPPPSATHQAAGRDSIVPRHLQGHTRSLLGTQALC